MTCRAGAEQLPSSRQKPRRTHRLRVEHREGGSEPSGPDTVLLCSCLHTWVFRFIWIKLTPLCRADRVTEPAEHNALPECSAMVTDQPFVPHSAAVIITMVTLSHVARQQSEMHPPGVSSRAVLSAPGLNLFLFNVVAACNKAQQHKLDWFIG